MDTSLFGILATSGLGGCDNTKLELFFDGKPMTLARYPNLNADNVFDKSQWLRVDTVANLSTFTTSADRARAWAGEDDAWLHGYWSSDWADQWFAVESTRPRADGKAGVELTVKVVPAMSRGVKHGAKFYAVNLLSELDCPGEYYVDRRTSVLHFWPPGDVEAAEVMVSASPQGMVVGASADSVNLAAARMQQQLLLSNAASRAASTDAAPEEEDKGMLWEQSLQAEDDARALLRREAAQPIAYLSFAGFGVYYTRGTGLTVVNGEHVALEDIEVAGVGQGGVLIDGFDIQAAALHVADAGCRGVSMSGGDTRTLQGSQMIVRDSTIHRYARRTRTYNAGVAFSGVGHVVRGNTVGAAPHTGILGKGNDCDFEGNTLHDLGWESSDTGAWYTGRTWTQRGHRVVGNTFTRIRNRGLMALGYPAVIGVYLDDQVSGITVVNNSFVDVQMAVLLGGGVDNMIGFNSFSKVDVGVHIDTRGEKGQAPGTCNASRGSMPMFVDQLLRVDYQSPPYASRYPTLPTYLLRAPCTPHDLRVVGNAIADSGGASVVVVPKAVFVDPLNTFAFNDGSVEVT